MKNHYKRDWKIDIFFHIHQDKIETNELGLQKEDLIIL